MFVKLVGYIIKYIKSMPMPLINKERKIVENSFLCQILFQNEELI